MSGNIWYSQIAVVQAGGVNVLANLNDPNLDNGRVTLITGTYAMTGNETQNDVVYIARVPSGALVDPSSSMFGFGAAATATVSIGDTDTQGGTVAPNPARYSAAVNLQGSATASLGFAGGTTLQNPAEITDDWVWLTATFVTLVTPAAGVNIVFRIKLSGLD